jgi:hypothetical protein
MKNTFLICDQTYQENAYVGKNKQQEVWQNWQCVQE